MSDIKIGDKFWIKDTNRRSYKNGQNQYRYHFVQVEITGETSRSYIVNGGMRYEFKAPKRDPFKYVGGEYGFSKQLLTTDMMEDEIWCQSHRHKVISKLQASPGFVIKEVAEMIGYKEEE